jgi:hypothetical protein
MDWIKPHLGTSPVSPATHPFEDVLLGPLLLFQCRPRHFPPRPQLGGAPVAARNGRPAAGEIRERVPDNPGDIV